MDSFDYKKFYNEVGQMNGWDFSRLNVIVEDARWNFWNEISSRCKAGDIVLDIGTGGGEALLRMADAALLLIGIDHSEAMIHTANRNRERIGRSNVRFLPMEASKLDFPERFFQVISCRHSEFNAAEVARVLTDDGVFLTQQVGESDKSNLAQAFGRGQSGNTKRGTLMNRYAAELKEAGFRQIDCRQYDAVEYYATAEDLIFLLKHTPIIPGFGQSASDFQTLHRFIAEHHTPKGIRTNADRFMIIASK
ncbi:SAM-dependent methyltransferase [Paenibacillus rhizosphaerae]|uniref:SAM-dependent methyltransferase n=1 Tax=Paenibacillus rhizosphaerae TaxID=297318 RepID=A0A839TZY2_9BACL|nr:class I SAM-dependent methyltransferase [Paenibacillus rhizosphaerae]MBB3131080.1 SAM-dependent methyltransferase [Paenibacillus rhizosphaerae]